MMKINYHATLALPLIISVAAFSSQLLHGGETNASSLCVVIIMNSAAVMCCFLQKFTIRAEELHNYVIPLFFYLLFLFICGLSETPFHLDAPHYWWRLVNLPATASIDHSQTHIEILKSSALLGAFICGISAGSSSFSFKACLDNTMGFGVLLAVVSILCFATAPSTVYWIIDKQIFDDRLTASYSSANTAGVFFGSLALISLFSFFSKLEEKNVGSPAEVFEAFVFKNSMTIVALLTFYVTLVLTASRAAILLTSVATILGVFVEARIMRWPVRRVIIIACICTTVIPLFFLVAGHATLIDRVKLLGTDSAVRREIITAHIPIVREAPLTGYGLGSFRALNTSNLFHLKRTVFNDLWFVGSMHNAYLQLIEAVGLIGAMALSAALVTVLTPIARMALKFKKTSRKYWLILLTTFLVMSQGFSDYALQDLAIACWWCLLMGMGLSQASSAQSSVRTQPH